MFLKAEILLGAPACVGPDGNPNITFESLLMRELDSVIFNRSTGLEYVVYASDQVRNIALVEM